jgi:enoyl-CoA hydratase
MQYIHFEERVITSGKLGLITLDRCSALNALTVEMITALKQQLENWGKQEEVIAIVMLSHCERAFSAGGDLRALYEGRNHLSEQLNLFRSEYQLNYLIATYPKPIVVLLNGIVMGGGAGISIHASHRVACETLSFAMPETGIGLFPDVGSSYFLNKMPGALGNYLALSGARINVADAVYAGIVDYNLSSNHYSDVLQALTELPLTHGSVHDNIAQILSGFAIQPDQSIYQEKKDFIESVFDTDQVSNIINYLRQDDREWSKAVAIHLQQKSPTSLMVTLKAMRQAKGQNLAFCLKQDFILMQTFLQNNDAYEGIRAVIIDKDMRPAWQPSTLDNLSDDQIQNYFDCNNKELLTL